MLKIGFLVWCIMAALVSSASANTNLDQFLAGLDRGCRGSASFEAFRDSLIRRYIHPKDPNQGIAVPDPLKTFVEPIVVSRMATGSGGHWFHVFVPFRGLFRGLEIAAVEFGFGDGNGIHVSALIFSSSISTVRAVLGRNVQRANKRAREEFRRLEAKGESGSDPETLAIEIVEGRTKLTCDMST